MKTTTINLFRDELSISKTKEGKLSISIGSKKSEITRPAAQELLNALQEFLDGKDAGLEEENERP